jgi:hypothetical protein
MPIILIPPLPRYRPVFFIRLQAMTGTDSPSAASWFSLRAFLAREWSYLLMLGLALFGDAYTSISHAPVRSYWLALCPIFALVCIGAGWREAGITRQRFHLMWTQVLHWGAVLLAIELTLVADVAHMMNADSKALSALTILALGTVTAGLHTDAWRICVIGVILALGVPGIAWLEQSVLLIALIVVAVIAIIAPLGWMMYEHRSDQSATAS